MKSNTVKLLAGAVVAGAAFTAAAPAAHAQHVGFAVSFGAPAPQYYYAPAPRYYDQHAYWEARRREEARARYWEWRRHEEHERWEHARPYGYGGYYGR